jgi:outer membrane protein assembly factor BamE (lipoprotein component of BamABCDE complex)
MKRFLGISSGLLLTAILLFAFSVDIFSHASNERIEIFYTNRQKIQKGMTKQQVKELLGTERNFFTFAVGKQMKDMDVWTYTPSRSGGIIKIFFDKNNQVKEFTIYRDEDDDSSCLIYKNSLVSYLCYILY